MRKNEMNTAIGIESLSERRKNYKKRRKVKALKVTNKRCVFSKKGRKNVCDEKEGRGSQHFYPAPISGWVIKLLFKHAAEKSFFEESSERITKESSKEALPEKCPYSELFRSVFFYIGTEYREILRISPYSSECGKIQTGITPNTDTFYIVKAEKVKHLAKWFTMKN